MWVKPIRFSLLNPLPKGNGNYRCFQATAKKNRKMALAVCQISVLPFTQKMIQSHSFISRRKYYSNIYLSKIIFLLSLKLPLCKR